ncbi:hypothetical protein FW774_16450 [Pedobacter sp. BS3]|uniref:hypothetical protein n=1 Tax=Pedobacter sp. BS3 TaxID=2567937 RepID=UPI0011EC5A89|nr:hypothetical protein [Pedobacter sp. BS3]TZF82274.1 hypothetical protein FW774_16450 [Pedobacter sp. BS3]
MKYLTCILISVCCTATTFAQQLGLNFNHNPENINFKYIAKTQVQWLRTTPRILDYVDGKLNLETDTAIQKVTEAGKKGYKIVFGLRWDFAQRKLAMPEPGSEREKTYFAAVDNILNRVGPYVNIFTLGNEPNLETIESDLQYNQEHQVPLVIFTRRLMHHVISFYKNHPGWKQPQLYAGSLPALFEKKQQQKPGVSELIKFAQNNKEITGLAIHLHIADTLQIAEAFRYVRTLMPDKPIIVPEFSLFRLYNKHFNDVIAASAKGQAFIKKYNLPQNLKVYEWLSLVNTGKIPYQQWEEMFLSQSWYIPHYLNTYYRYFKQNNVVLATYPLLQQGYVKRVTPASDSWFLNPLFLQKSFGLNSNGEFYTNPLVYTDYINLLQKTKQ